MTSADIVLGLGFGDEGKGRTVDYLCSQAMAEGKSPLVIRFSGGPQAGHTVMRDGKKHIHSSFGSGTMLGVPSYFTEDTCIYPPNLMEEFEVMRRSGIKTPILSVHPLAKLITPFDVAYNRMRAAENTVGIGVGVAMKRHEQSGYKIFAHDMTYPKLLRAKLLEIATYYATEYSFVYGGDLKEIVDDFMVSCYKLLQVVSVNKIDLLGSEADHLIFEGSQGIMLDQEHGVFPNVTYAYTTSRNIWKYGVERIDTTIYYVTRCYQTRHGAGWMSSIPTDLVLVNNKEETNVTNEWQGDLRIGELDYNLLQHALGVDTLYSQSTRRALVVTCLDQRPDFEFKEGSLGGWFEKILKFRSPINEEKTFPVEIA
jgi:adenylosuccinate synthase